MRKFFGASILLLALCCPAYAGDMLTPPVTPPESSPVCEEPEPAAAEENGSPTLEAYFAQLAESFFDGVLALF